jgi:hypothetical protein
MTSCAKVNEIKQPSLENYWVLEEEIYKVNPKIGTKWVNNLNAITSTSTAESVVLIQFREKPSVPGKYIVKAYSPTGADQLKDNECALAVLGAPGKNNYNSTGKEGEELEVIEIKPGKMKYFIAGIELKSGSKGSLFTMSVIEK